MQIDYSAHGHELSGRGHGDAYNLIFAPYCVPWPCTVHDL